MWNSSQDILLFPYSTVKEHMGAAPDLLSDGICLDPLMCLDEYLLWSEHEVTEEELPSFRHVKGWGKIGNSPDISL